MNTKFESRTSFPWRALLCSCLFVGSGQGILTGCAGLFIRPVCTANGFDMGPYTIQMSLSAIAMMIAFTQASKVMKKFPIKRILFVCVAVQTGVFMLYSQLTQLWMFYLAAPFQGLACAVPSYIIGPLLISNWFEKKRGMAMGITMACNGIFGAIFNVVGSNLISSVGYRASYLILGGTAAALMGFAALFCVPHPSMRGQRAYGAETGEEQARINAEAGVAKAQAIRSAPFLLMFLTVSLIVCAGAFSPQISVLAMSKGFPMSQAGSFMGVYMIGGLLGSFGLGWLNDRAGIRNSTIAALLMGVLAIALLTMSGNSAIVLSVGLAMLGAAAAAAGVQPPMIVGKLFGQKDYVAIYGVMQIALSLGGIFASPMYGFVLDAAGSYNPALIGVAAALAGCIPMTFLAFRKKSAAGRVAA